MAPGVIVKEAQKKELNLIGICDHNATENVRAVKKACLKGNVAVLGGMEIMSQEEVHVLALFDDDQKLSELQAMVYDNLPGVNDERAFGEQVVVNENDEVVDVNDHLLIGATSLPLHRIVEAIHSLSGLAIASHVDREGFGIIAQLGFIPEGLPLDALEVSPRISVREARVTFPEICRFPLVTFSDAHSPEHIGSRCTTFLIEDSRVGEIRKALLQEGGRVVSPEE